MCGQPYSAHTPLVIQSVLPSSTLSLSSSSVNHSSVQSNPSGHADDQFFTNMASHSIPQYQASTTSNRLATISGPSLVNAYTTSVHRPPPQSQGAPVTRGHMAFGVPMAGVSTSSTSLRGHTRGRGQRITVSAPLRTIHAQLILMPRDVSDVNAVVSIAILTCVTAHV